MLFYYHNCLSHPLPKSKLDINPKFMCSKTLSCLIKRIKGWGRVLFDNCHYLALLFSHAEDLVFNRVLQNARATNHKYEPPKRHQVAVSLLHAQFASYQKHSLEDLLSDADTNGLGIFRNGATIVKTPMMNVLQAPQQSKLNSWCEWLQKADDETFKMNDWEIFGNILLLWKNVSNKTE